MSAIQDEETTHSELNDEATETGTDKPVPGDPTKTTPSDPMPPGEYVCSYCAASYRCKSSLAVHEVKHKGQCKKYLYI